ncbi:MAG: M48 family metallopeptidase, partial [Alistipes sp.]|nr:M48 family metallopeptidase [Alistipes sp.]
VSQRRALAFLDEKAGWVETARQRLAARRAALAPALPPEEEKARIEELRRAAKVDLPERAARLSRQTGLRYEKLTVRAARTKWGSCSAKGSISLSLFLMTLPEHLRDFVIIHELCHTVHHDHSPRFHALVDRLTGGHEKALSRELRAFSIR